MFIVGLLFVVGRRFSAYDGCFLDSRRFASCEGCFLDSRRFSACDGCFPDPRYFSPSERRSSGQPYVATDTTDVQAPFEAQRNRGLGGSF